MIICHNKFFMLCEIKRRAEATCRDVRPFDVNRVVCLHEYRSNTEMFNDDV